MLIRTLSLTLMLLLPVAAQAQYRNATLRGELNRDGSFSYHAEKGGAKQHWLVGQGGIYRHPSAREIGRQPVTASTSVVVRKPDGRTQVMTFGELKKLQRSTASAHSYNQGVRRRQRAERQKGVQFRPCVDRPKPGLTITGAKLFQDLGHRVGKRPTKDVKQIKLEIAPGAVKPETFDGKPWRVKLGAAKKKYRSIYNGRPISSWTVFAYPANKKSDDGSALYNLTVKAWASEYSSGTGGTQTFRSGRNLSASQICAGTGLCLNDSELTPPQ
jgi:hypothetical protein